MNGQLPDSVTRDYMVAVLREHHIEVVFEKADGSMRTMRCTLNPKLIPEGEKPHGVGTNGLDTTIRVFDTERKDWRSFRVNSVQSFKMAL